MVEEVIDPETGKRVRPTDNGPKDGDLPGIDPSGMTTEELLAKLSEAIGEGEGDGE